MEWLNYHHLLYFWTVAKEGTIAKASDTLRLSQPTISEQIRNLEGSLGVKLFQKQGRNLVLTKEGQLAYRYSDEIFSRGRELTDVLRGAKAAHAERLNIGIADVVPKFIAYRLILPALKLPNHPRMICREGRADKLIAQLAIHELDLVISDAPLDPSIRVQAYSHLLGRSGLSFFAHSRLMKGAKKDFPDCLNGMPFLLPAEKTDLRRSLDHWFEAQEVHPKIAGEFDDSALAAVFAEDGVGAFAAPTATEMEVCRQFDVKVLGRTQDILESFYAISLDRKLKHPALMAISKAAHSTVFRN